MVEYDELLLSLQGVIEQLKENLSSGSAKDYADYKRTCGIVEGLGIARREIEERERHTRETL